MMLSGIGPSAQLTQHGIPLVHDMPGIGENYQDHPMLTMTFKTNPANTKPLMCGRSSLKLYFKTDPAREYLNFHIIPREAISISGIGDMLGFSCNLLEQTNRGKLTLQSADPDDLPSIDPQVLEHPKDIAAMLASDSGLKEVTAADRMARNAGIQGVPSFALQGHVLFSGAVPAEEMADTFRRAWELLKNKAA